MAWFDSIINNRFVQLILIVLVIFALLSFLGFHFGLEIGSSGISAGVTRGGA